MRVEKMGKYAITQTIVPTADISLSQMELEKIEELARGVKMGTVMDNIDELRVLAKDSPEMAIEKLNQLAKD